MGLTYEEMNREVCSAAEVFPFHDPATRELMKSELPDIDATRVVEINFETGEALVIGLGKDGTVGAVTFEANQRAARAIASRSTKQ